MIKVSAPKSHPRYLSNLYRDIISQGVKDGIVSLQGLTAHGRGETFDYLIGEKTEVFSKEAIVASAATLLLAKYPVISVNGNTATLVPKELIKLANILHASLEVNLFHHSKKRENKIVVYLKKFGARKVLLPDGAKIPGIESNRRMISEEGLFKADVVFVPLEDGDRTEALIVMGKKVITVDLNPLSRTARTATVTIVDNIVRAMPLLIKTINKLKNKSKKQLSSIIKKYDNARILSGSLTFISRRLNQLSKEEIQ